jgi:hypothetical protein
MGGSEPSFNIYIDIHINPISLRRLSWELDQVLRRIAHERRAGMRQVAPDIYLIVGLLHANVLVFPDGLIRVDSGTSQKSKA